MKKLIVLAMLISIAGCSRPIIIDNGVQTRVFTPCTKDSLCFRDTYNITWDNWCAYDRDYPVSYRSKQTEYESSKVEYILLPKTVYESGN